MSSPLGYPVGYLWRHLFVANIRYGSFQCYLWTTLIVVYDVDSTHMATVTSKMSKTTSFFCFQGDFSIEGGFLDHFTYSLLFRDEPVPRTHSSSSSDSSIWFMRGNTTSLSSRMICPSWFFTVRVLNMSPTKMFRLGDETFAIYFPNF